MPKGPLISPEYAALNKQLHAEHPAYGIGAAKDAAPLVGLAAKVGARVILDFGCGKGVLKPAVKAIDPGLTVLEYDPAIPGKDTLPTQAVDMIAAMDVMEHIEPDYLDAVLEAMREMRPKIVTMKIALTPALKTLPDGRNAHILLRPADWWVSQLERYFKTGFRQDMDTHLTYVGRPLP